MKCNSHNLLNTEALSVSKLIRCPTCGAKPSVKTITFDYLTMILCDTCGSIPMHLRVTGDPEKPLKKAKPPKTPKPPKMKVRMKGLRLSDLPLEIRKKLEYPD